MKGAFGVLRHLKSAGHFLPFRSHRFDRVTRRILASREKLEKVDEGALLDSMHKTLERRRQLNSAYAQLLEHCDIDDLELADAGRYGLKLLSLDYDDFNEGVGEAERFLKSGHLEDALVRIRTLTHSANSVTPLLH